MDDVEDAYRMNCDPLVQKYIVGEGEPTLENVRHMMQNNVLGDYEKHGFGRMAVIHKADRKYIGFTGLKFVEELGEVDVGLRLNSAYWGQGLATEATAPTIEYGFQKLGLNRIVAAALPENRASIRVMEKLGLRFEKRITIDHVEMVCYAINKPHVSPD